MLDSFFATDEKARSEFNYLRTLNQKLDKVDHELQSGLAIGPNINPQAYFTQQNKLKEQIEKEILKSVADLRK